MKRHRIFTTYGDTPIKNVKTPIRRFSGEPEDEENVQENTIAYAEVNDPAVDLLSQIRTLLVILIIIKIICLCIKK